MSCTFFYFIFWQETLLKFCTTLLIFSLDHSSLWTKSYWFIQVLALCMFNVELCIFYLSFSINTWMSTHKLLKSLANGVAPRDYICGGKKCFTNKLLVDWLNGWYRGALRGERNIMLVERVLGWGKVASLLGSYHWNKAPFLNSKT